MKINIGNIEPLSEIKISFTYVEELKVVQNKFYRYCLRQGNNNNMKYNLKKYIFIIYLIIFYKEFIIYLFIFLLGITPRYNNNY